MTEGSEDLTLLMIHGLGASKEMFTGAYEQPELTRYTMIAPDLVGFGDSSKPEGFTYTMEEQARTLLGLLDALGVDGGVVLVAHSMGGAIAVALGELLGRRLAGVVYAEGNLDFGDCFFSNLIITRSKYEEWIARGFKRMADSLRRSAGGFAETFTSAGARSIYISSVDLVTISREDTLLGRLTALGVPVLAVFGEDNRGKFASEEKLGKRFPLVHIPGAGHNMMQENPDAFYGAVATYLSEL